jgi:V/A-type H+-transporting ATPase subunit K
VKHSKLVIVVLAVVIALTIGAGVSWAADEAAPAAAPEKTRSIPTALIAIAAALAIGLPAFGTAIAQSRIGAAGCGTIAEKPDTAGTIILLIAIPETMVILGFVVAVVLVFAL